MKYCPYCGKEVQQNDRFCLDCGSALGNQDQAESPENQSDSPNVDENAPDMKRCYACDMPVSDSDAFCLGCGSPLQKNVSAEVSAAGAVSEIGDADDQALFCGQCGAAVSSGDMFCPDCGAATGEDKAAAQQFSPDDESGNIREAEDEMDDAKPKRKLNIWYILIPVLAVIVMAIWYFVFGFGAKKDGAPAGSAYESRMTEAPQIESHAGNPATAEASAVSEEGKMPVASSAEAPGKSPQQTPAEIQPNVAKPKTEVVNNSSKPANKSTSGGAAKSPAESQKAKTVIIFSNWNDLPMRNNPSRPVRFETDREYLVTSITTRHFNDGKGVKPGGTITIVDERRKEYGPWTCKTKPDKNGVPDALWICYPNVTLPTGKYRVINSDEKSWSFNLESGKRGMIIIEGQPVK